VKTFDRLCKNLDISEKALAKTLNIAISTLARRKKTGRMTFGESAVLKEPSVVVPEEYNFLLNPNHPDFEKITIGTPIVYPFDPRLAR
jgi:hypothetical protein